MPSVRPKSCRGCEGLESEVGRISWRGLCTTCGNARYMQNHHEMMGRPKGAYFAHWRRRTLQSLGGVPAEDEASR